MKSRIKMWIAASVFTALALPIGIAAQDSSSSNHPRHHTYQFIDLGTLGGLSSHVGGDGPGSRFLNNQGVVAGGADTSVPGVSDPFRWRHGSLSDLGTYASLRPYRLDKRGNSPAKLDCPQPACRECWRPGTYSAGWIRAVTGKSVRSNVRWLDLRTIGSLDLPDGCCSVLLV